MAVLKKSSKAAGRKSPVSAKKITPPKKSGARTKKKAPAGKKVASQPPKPCVKAKKPVPVVKRVSKKRPDVLPVVTVVESTRVLIQKKVIPLSPKPTALTCPLVLDGIILADDFSPRDCFSCDEFDCRFYSAEERLGTPGGRLFAGDEEDEEGDEWGLFGELGEEPEEEDGWGSDDE
jgi:hypothetical protein